jgi:sulfur-oxidizing protein SoxZ
MATNPMKIRANNKDGVTEVKVLISHEMETGQRKDAAGALVPAWFITELTAKHNDRVVLGAEFGTAISKNPYLAFRFKGGAKGDKLSVSWKDSKGETRTDEAAIA